LGAQRRAEVRFLTLTLDGAVTVSDRPNTGP